MYPYLLLRLLLQSVSVFSDPGSLFLEDDGDAWAGSAYSTRCEHEWRRSLV